MSLAGPPDLTTPPGPQEPTPPNQNIEPQYQYDVYLSYRRANAWPRFVDTIFLPMLRHWLEAETGQPPKIFFDVDEIETGHSWPHRLAHGIALSKVLVCLWSNEFFHSPWCQAELSHMLARIDLLRRQPPLPLILAAVIHDGDNIPSELQNIQRFAIQEYANPWLAHDSPNAEVLSGLIRKFSTHVAHAIQQAPPCDPAWSDLATDRFLQLFHQGADQNAVPSLA